MARYDAFTVGRMQFLQFTTGFRFFHYFYSFITRSNANEKQMPQKMSRNYFESVRVCVIALIESFSFISHFDILLCTFFIRIKLNKKLFSHRLLIAFMLSDELNDNLLPAWAVKLNELLANQITETFQFTVWSIEYTPKKCDLLLSSLSSSTIPNWCLLIETKFQRLDNWMWSAWNGKHSFVCEMYWRTFRPVLMFRITH